MRSRTFALTAVVTLLLAGFVAGCGGDGESDADAQAPTATASSAPTASDDSAPTTEPDDQDSVAPATGRVIVAKGVTDPGITYRVPAEGRWTFSRGGETAGRYDRSGRSVITHGALAFGDVSLDDLAKSAVRSHATSPTTDVERGENRTIAGSEWYVVEARDPQRGFEYEVGAIRDADNSHLITFTFSEETPQARELIESVLATVEWR